MRVEKLQVTSYKRQKNNKLQASRSNTPLQFEISKITSNTSVIFYLDQKITSLENKKTVYSFFSWKNFVIVVIVFFVMTMILGYLFDRKEYASLEHYLRSNSLRKGVMSIVMGFVISFFRAKQLKKEFEMNED